MFTSASHAKPRHRLGSDFRAFAQACLRIVGVIFGPASTIARTVKRDELRQSAQADALANLNAIYARKCKLMIERQILIAERKEAIRLHKAVCSTDRRLKAITHELLSIG